MRCISCDQVFQTTDFYDHIIVKQECVIESELEYNHDYTGQGMTSDDQSMAFQIADAHCSRIVRDLSAENEDRILKQELMPFGANTGTQSMEIYGLDSSLKQIGQENRPYMNNQPISDQHQ